MSEVTKARDTQQTLSSRIALLHSKRIIIMKRKDFFFGSSLASVIVNHKCSKYPSQKLAHFGLPEPVLTKLMPHIVLTLGYIVVQIVVLLDSYEDTWN